MSTATARNYISNEEYLEGEKKSDIRHEYIRGEVFAMTGASDKHITITSNILVLLKLFLKGKKCRVYPIEMKARIDSEDCFFYPDILVTCDEKDKGFGYFKKSPKLIAEVLSPSTEAFDRGKKFAYYRNIPTLEEYALISQDKKSAEVFRKNESGHWTLFPFGENENVELHSIDFFCNIDELYEDVDFELQME